MIEKRLLGDGRRVAWPDGVKVLVGMARGSSWWCQVGRWAVGGWPSGHTLVGGLHEWLYGLTRR
ncbi:hypothetical protein Patl1_20037 [Pistacia atlantica]|uniref:Uncharacterized protein n=1 Tax=Pistacia atlantica TaxID=434234 RepID=A0ACC1BIJ3_9ROSI|nr:hypothetical protein Patl1_20037 [Pistacia atlantica]